METAGRNRRQGYALLERLSGRAQDELARVGRSFRLQEGEELLIRGMGEGDHLYLLSGSVVISHGAAEQVMAADDAGLAPFAMPKGMEPVRVRARTDAVLQQVDLEHLDYLVFWDELAEALDDRELRRRFRILRNCMAFRRLPAENVREAVARMQVRAVRAGDDVVTQGAPGDAFYLIDEGSAEVWSQGLYDDAPQRVNRLGPGDSFGEEALVTGGTRTATVRMLEDGTLLTLGKSDFDALVRGSLVNEVSAAAAKAMLEEPGTRLLDVRYLEESEESQIPGGLQIPLADLRQRAAELDPSLRYIAYCRSGRRSAAATFLLRERKFNVLSLAGGIRDWPYEKVSGI